MYDLEPPWRRPNSRPASRIAVSTAALPSAGPISSSPVSSSPGTPDIVWFGARIGAPAISNSPMLKTLIGWKRLAGRALDDRLRRRPVELEAECTPAEWIDVRGLVADDLDVIVAGFRLVCDPARSDRRADERPLVVLEAEQDRVGHHVPVIGDRHELLGLPAPNFEKSFTPTSENNRRTSGPLK
jgi:hypothetical protein